MSASSVGDASVEGAASPGYHQLLPLKPRPATPLDVWKQVGIAAAFALLLAWHATRITVLWTCAYVTRGLLTSRQSLLVAIVAGTIAVGTGNAEAATVASRPMFHSVPQSLPKSSLFRPVVVEAPRPAPQPWYMQWLIAPKVWLLPWLRGEQCDKAECDGAK